MSLGHLAKRFVTSLLARPLPAADAKWVEDQLLAGELELWNRMTTPDQVHAHGVARRTVARLDDRATRPVIAAALLHDVGKLDSGLGTLGRSLATVMANAGFTTDRVKRYRAHNEIGRTMLIAAGSDPFTALWAFEHELPRAQWTTESDIADALHEADGD